MEKSQYQILKIFFLFPIFIVEDFNREIVQTQMYIWMIEKMAVQSILNLISLRSKISLSFIFDFLCIRRLSLQLSAPFHNKKTRKSYRFQFFSSSSIHARMKRGKWKSCFLFIFFPLIFFSVVVSSKSSGYVCYFFYYSLDIQSESDSEWFRKGRKLFKCINQTGWYRCTPTDSSSFFFF